MAQKIKNLFQKNTQPQTKRDNAGRFTSGTGGLKSVKKLPLRRMIPVIAVIALTGGFLVFQSMAAPPSGATWKLVWSDEFNGSSVDSSKWTPLKNSGYGSGNKQDECNRAENISVSGGTLKITAKNEVVKCGTKNPQGPDNTYYFTSGVLTTRAVEGQPVKMKYKHGYFETRFRMPKGNIFWGGAWLVGPNDGSTPGHPDYGEFDVSEPLSSRPETYIGTAHFACNRPNGEKFSCNSTGANMYNFTADSTSNSTSNWGYKVDSRQALNNFSGPGIYDYVTYGFEWDDKQIAWYVNGKKIRYIDVNANVYALQKDGSFRKEFNIEEKKGGKLVRPLSTVFNYDHSIILNLAVGGNMNTGERGTYTGNEVATGGYNYGNMVADFPAHLEVDYVRVYKKDGDGRPPIPPSKLQTPSGLKVVPAEKSAKVSWTKSSDTRANQYQVRYKTGSGGWTTSAKVSATDITISGLAQGAKYDFQVQALDSTGKNPASDYSVTVQATIPEPQPETTGLRAAYFGKGGYRTKPVYRTDRDINFNWGSDVPFAGHDADFSVRWSGKIIAPVSGTYTFTTRSDDGMNLWIRGSRIIESWKRQSVTEKSATVQLTAGQSYDIEVEYYDGGGAAVAQLYWQYPGQAKQIVPTNVLRPTANTGLSGRFYAKDVVLKRNDKQINFDWGTSKLGALLPADNVLVNWVGTVRVPTTGSYTFTSRSDDGFTLSVDGRIVVDDWSLHSARERSGTIRLEAGKEYAIYVAYYENTGSAVAQLYWSGPGIAKSIVPESALQSN